MQTYNPTFLIDEYSIHVWQFSLSRLFLPESCKLSSIYEDFPVSMDEITRANHFTKNYHRQRYVMIRSALRYILNLYSPILLEHIPFAYGLYGKPFLPDYLNPLQVQFNLSHSGDKVVIALTKQHKVGIDIEKIKTEHNALIAKRFFSEQECNVLETLSGVEKTVAFFRIWAKKESIVKTLGKSLYTSSKKFSVSLQKENEQVLLGEHPFSCYLQYLFLEAGYEAAFATTCQTGLRVALYSGHDYFKFDSVINGIVEV